VADDAQADTEAPAERKVISTLFAAPEGEAETLIGGDESRWPHCVSYLNVQFILELGCFTPGRTSALRLCASNSHSEVWILSPDSTAQLAASDPGATAQFVAEWNNRTRFIQLPDAMESLERLFGELADLAQRALDDGHVLFLREERYYPSRLD
jgi:hypothetical protein